MNMMVSYRCIPCDLISLINSPIFVDCHPHSLAYCFTKDRSNYGDSWRCNKCTSVFTYDNPSFYCTYCDFDLCKYCLEKYNVGNVYVFNNLFNNQNIMNLKQEQQNWIKNFPCHQHGLTLIEKVNKDFPWTCKLCSDSYNSDKKFFYCSICDYNLCQFCAQKNPILNNENQNLNVITAIFDLNGDKKKMVFNYGKSVSNMLKEYSEIQNLDIFGLVFVYNNAIIMNQEPKTIENFFGNNQVYIIVNNMKNNMMNNMNNMNLDGFRMG